jgi:hypothetical protein
MLNYLIKEQKIHIINDNIQLANVEKIDDNIDDISLGATEVDTAIEIYPIELYSSNIQLFLSKIKVILLSKFCFILINYVFIILSVYFVNYILCDNRYYIVFVILYIIYLYSFSKINSNNTV